jgi:hypothetical protein
MSALGQKQTHAVQQRMSAKGANSGHRQLFDHVRFTPNSGHVQRTSSCPLWANSGHS